MHQLDNVLTLMSSIYNQFDQMNIWLEEIVDSVSMLDSRTFTVCYRFITFTLYFRIFSTLLSPVFSLIMVLLGLSIGCPHF